MEKIDVSKLQPFRGDFVLLPPGWNVAGRGDDIITKKGTVASVVLVDTVAQIEVRLFADQLRQEGGQYFVSKAGLERQRARALQFAAGKVPPK